MSMCSFFSQKMEKDEGDLADVVRASGVGGVSGRGGCSSANNQVVEWQIPSQQQLHHQYQHVDTDVDVDLDLDLDLDVDVDVDFPSEPPPQAPAPPVMDNFGYPFCSIQDPLLHDIDLPDSSAFFDSSHLQSKMNIVQDHNTLLGGGNLLGGRTIFDQEMRRPSNIFSRMLQISPNSNMSISPCIITASPRAGGGVVKTSSSSSSSSSLVCNDLILKPDISTGCSSLDNQISSPRNPGIKRRKSQAKKVVCIPAPSAANNRPAGGEVVPSDLWAWRKYGQKPIKGSPYPRGYYRCSSSKGCSARKQVERSRTDPNMLVITYTSEHNHPWPTQRNALAGSTRSQPSKGNSNNSASKTSQNRSTQNSCYTMDEEQKDKTNDNGCIKEEMGVVRDKPADGVGSVDHQNNYKPQFPPKPNQTDDFFAELGELEPSHLFTTTQGGFTGGEERSNEGERDNNKALDPFSLFDWRS